jgi:hypothetical protein
VIPATARREFPAKFKLTLSDRPRVRLTDDDLDEIAANASLLIHLRRRKRRIPCRVSGCDSVLEAQGLASLDATYLCGNHPNEVACASFGRDHKASVREMPKDLPSPPHWPWVVGHAVRGFGHASADHSFQKHFDGAIRGGSKSAAEGTDHIKGQGGARKSRWSPQSEWHAILQFVHLVNSTESRSEDDPAWDIWAEYDGPRDVLDIEACNFDDDELDPFYRGYIQDPGFRYFERAESCPEFGKADYEKFCQRVRKRAERGEFGDFDALADESAKIKAARAAGCDPDLTRVRSLLSGDALATAATIEVLFEDVSTKEAARKANMKANTLIKRKTRAMKTELTLEQQSELVLDRLTPAQWSEINENGGLWAFNLSSLRVNARVETLRFEIGDRGTHHIVTLSDHALNTPRVNGWAEWEAKICDQMVDKAKRWTAWYAHLDRVKALPPAERAVAEKLERLDRSAWKQDKEAWRLAEQRWSNVVVFNFGAPGFISRFPDEANPAAWEAARLELVRSGRRPLPYACPSKQPDARIIWDHVHR